MDLPRDMTNQLFHLAQTRTGTPTYGLIGAVSGTPRACFPLNKATECEAAELMAQFQAEGLALFATFALAEDLSSPPQRPQSLALPSLPHLVVGSRIKGVLEIDAYLEGPLGWSMVELRLPEV